MLSAHNKPGEFEIFPSAVRNATVRSGVFFSGGSQSLVVILDVTVVPGVDAVGLFIETFNVANASWLILGETLVDAGVGSHGLMIGQGVGDLWHGISIDGHAHAHHLPARWRVGVEHDAGGNFTYSVAGWLM